MPEIKYCERCGLFLGAVHAATRYCHSCKADVNQERRKKYKSKNPIPMLQPIDCAFCGKPLVRKTGSQKYHLECSMLAQKAKARESAKIRKSIKKELERKKKKEQLSIADVSRMAEKAGVSYGEMLLRLAKEN